MKHCHGHCKTGLTREYIWTSDFWPGRGPFVVLHDAVECPDANVRFAWGLKNRRRG